MKAYLVRTLLDGKLRKYIVISDRIPTNIQDLENLGKAKIRGEQFLESKQIHCEVIIQ